MVIQWLSVIILSFFSLNLEANQAYPTDNRLVAVVEGTPISYWDLKIEQAFLQQESKRLDLKSTRDHLIQQLMLIKESDRFADISLVKSTIRNQVEACQKTFLRLKSGQALLLRYQLTPNHVFQRCYREISILEFLNMKRRSFPVGQRESHEKAYISQLKAERSIKILDGDL